MYDITRRSTFENLSRWLEDLREVAYNKMVVLLVGNKADLAGSREVSTEEGTEFAKKHNLIFYETSAKTGLNIEQAFVTSAVVINENIKSGEYDLRTENIGIKPGSTFKANFDQNSR